MSDLVVVDSENKVIVSDTATSAVIISPVSDSIVVWGQMGPPGPQGPAGPQGPQGAAGINRISEALDVDVTGIVNGSILSYNTTTQKWVVNGDLDGPVYSVDGNSGNVTAAQLLTAIKKEDGIGSGLDADLLDGLNTSSTNLASTVVTRDASGYTGIGAVNFDTTIAEPTNTVGRLWWNNADGAQTLSLGITAIHDLKLGQESFYRVKASTAITKGQVVMATGAVGNSGVITAAPATGLTPETGIYVMGIATENIAQNAFGYVTEFGLVHNLNTTNVGENWTDGTILYLDPSIPGGLTKYIHTAPAPKVLVAMVVHAQNNGSLFVRVNHGSVLGGTDGNVEFASLADGDQIVYNGSLQRWENKPLAGSGLDQITTITKSLTITTDWQDTGIKSTDLTTGTYMVQLFANDISSGGVNNNEYYSGTMSWYAGNTDSSVELPTDEIPLHRAGASGDAGMYLRTYRTPSADANNLKLQIYSNVANPSAANYVFKFRRMI